MNIKEKIEERMQQCRWSFSILGMYHLSSGRISKVVSAEQKSVPSLIVRLKLQPIPNGYYGKMAATWVAEQIKERFPNKVSRHVVSKISRYYGVSLYHRGFFRVIPGKPRMLRVMPISAF